MSLGLFFWIVYIVATLFGGFYWRGQPWLPGLGVPWLLIGVLGWKAFGFPIQG